MKNYINADELLNPIFIERERRETKMEDVKEHLHNFYELYFLVDGQIDSFIGSRTYHLKPFDMIVITPNILHKSLLCKDYRHERIVLYFDERAVKNTDILKRFSAVNGVITLPNEAAKRVFKLLNIIMSDPGDDEWYETYVSSLVCETLITILRNYKSGHESYAGAKFNEIIDYVKENCTEQISLHSVAEHFFMSDAHLSRLFRKFTGFTFTQYVNYQRIILSHSMLANKSISIGKVALECGFENLTHFGRVFRQLTGYSPREYRKRITY